VHAKVGVEFVKNVFLVDCLLLKNIKLILKKSYRPLVGPIEIQGSYTAAATKYQGADHACYSSDVCGHSTTVYSYNLSMRTRFAVDAVSGECLKY